MTAPPFALIGLDHLLLHVSGMAEARRFYCEVLGCEVKHRLPVWKRQVFADGSEEWVGSA